MSRQQGSLLVVDDDELNRELLARRLRGQGYTVTVAATGNQALDLMRQQAFDLVLLDVVMPELSGLEVLKIVRQEMDALSLPVIMQTAKGHGSDVVEALKLGANDYVTKPFEFSVLLARMQTQLSVKHTAERNQQLEQTLQQHIDELALTNQALETANEELAAANRRMKNDLQLAARVQQSFLPLDLPEVSGARFAWYHQPCNELAGDLLNVVPIDDRYLGLYVLDVVGHGAAAALLAAMVNRVLARLLRRSVPGQGPLSPAKVAAHLAREFPWDDRTEQFFTILYGLLDLETYEFRFISAGHPGPIWINQIGEPAALRGSGLPIGCGNQAYEEYSIPLRPGDRLILYSDGVVDAFNENNQLFGTERVLQALGQGRAMPLKESLRTLLEGFTGWCGSVLLHDDVSLLACEVGEVVMGEASQGRVDLSADTLAGNSTADLVGLTPTPQDLWQGQETITRALAPINNRAPILSPGGDRAGTPPLPQAPAPAPPNLLMPPKDPNEIGWLGAYRILEVLGSGGMATVFLAEDVQLQRRVALKVMKPELTASAEWRHRFLREARAAAALEHDHIVTIYQVGQEGNTLFLAMQLLQGEALGDRLKREGRLPIREVLRIGREIADGLGAAHERGLIHRDIKPDNIWLETRLVNGGHLPRTRILDFGLAHVPNGQGQLTQTGLILGTPSYMSPEQARGQRVDPRSDLFSLGAVLYRMSAGQTPFEGSDPLAILIAVAVDEPKSLTEVNPEVPQALADLVEKLLAKNPDHRPPSALAVIDTIKRIERGKPLSGSLCGADTELDAQPAP